MILWLQFPWALLLSKVSSSQTKSPNATFITLKRQTSSFANPMSAPRLTEHIQHWGACNSCFVMHFIPAMLQVFVMTVSILMGNLYFREVFENTPGGIPTVLAMDLNELYNCSLTIFDIAVEGTSALTTLLTLKCTSLTTSHVKTYVDNFFLLITVCSSHHP
jgi:hypothetical protein